jgi:ribosome-associated toxin RatA of RatAB toxin-antitoxin module
MAGAAEDFSVDVERSEASFRVSATATMAASAAQAWEVLTDYASLPRFIPGLASSIVHLRAGSRVLVEQKGEARFFIFSYPIDVRLEIMESPHDWITSRGVGGTLRRMSGRYDLRASRGGTVLRYSGELEPDFDLPPLIGTLAVRTMVEEQFAAMVAEIERRAAPAK